MVPRAGSPRARLRSPRARSRCHPMTTSTPRHPKHKAKLIRDLVTISCEQKPLQVDLRRRRRRGGERRRRRRRRKEGRSVANLMKTGKREIFNNSSQAPERERENGERENGERESWRELKQSKLKIYE